MRGFQARYAGLGIIGAPHGLRGGLGWVAARWFGCGTVGGCGRGACGTRSGGGGGRRAVWFERQWGRVPADAAVRSTHNRIGRGRARAAAARSALELVATNPEPCADIPGGREVCCVPVRGGHTRWRNATNTRAGRCCQGKANTHPSSSSSQSRGMVADVSATFGRGACATQPRTNATHHATRQPRKLGQAARVSNRPGARRHIHEARQHTRARGESGESARVCCERARRGPMSKDGAH